MTPRTSGATPGVSIPCARSYDSAVDESHEALPLAQASTRFMPPRLRPEFVLRADLVDRVLSPDVHAVVVSGPAGSGKSILLAQAYEACPDAVWLSVEIDDDDPAVFWSALVDTTAATIPGFGEFYRHRLDTAGAEAVDGVVPLFVNELAATSRPIRFFLDDLHHVSGRRSIQSLQRLLHHLPPNISLVMASREATPFPLGRLRMERTLVELGPLDLTMDAAEARATLQAAGVEADDERVDALVSRTEGWVAGVAWATLAMTATSDAGSFVETVGRLDGDLTGYLIEEVLDRQPPELRAFMLETSILTRFNPALCDHARDRNDSRDLLDELDRTNSFLVPLDRNGEWYRYHHLVHDVLAARLVHETPAVTPILHRRAAAWLREDGRVVESIRHALAAGERRVAADTLCANWWGMMNGGRIETVHGLFEELGAAEICAYQPLAIAAAVLYSLAGDHQSAQVFARAAERGRHDGPSPDGAASMESALAIMRGSLAFDGVDATLAAGQRARELEPQGGDWWRLATFLVALGHIWRGELDAAEPELETVILSGGSNHALVVYALAERALLQLARTEIEAASASADSACTLAAETGLDTVFVTALAHGAAALIDIAVGDVHGADCHVDAAKKPMASVSTAMPIDAMRTRIVLADAAIRLGRSTEASGLIDDARRTSRRHRDTGVLAEQLDTVAGRLIVDADHAPVHLSEREQAVLELMPSELSIQGIADALFLSRETVKTHRRHIYRKLAVTSRADAVIAARHAGLLPGCGTAAAAPQRSEH